MCLNGVILEDKKAPLGFMKTVTDGESEVELFD
jgi:hypothetical protein